MSADKCRMCGLTIVWNQDLQAWADTGEYDSGTYCFAAGANYGKYHHL